MPLLWGEDQRRWLLFQEPQWRSRDRWRHLVTKHLGQRGSAPIRAFHWPDTYDRF